MKRFEGIIVPMMTPFRSNGELDTDRLPEFVSYLVEGGVHGLFPSSSIGEMSSMTKEERMKVIEIVREMSDVPVMAGTGCSDLATTIQLTKHAEDVGCDAIVVVTLYYLKPDQDGLCSYFGSVAKSTELPIFLYQIPMATGVEIEPDTVSSLRKRYDNIAGMKDSSGQLGKMVETRRKTGKDFLVFQGFDSLLLPSLQMGCPGGMVGTPNIIPGPAVELYKLFKEGRMEEAVEKQICVLGPFFETCMSAGVFPAGFKEAARILGVDIGPTRNPIRRLTPSEKDTMVNTLLALDL
jgi:4-hydroxy-tetrahydrodipicolinate synthase